MWPIITRVIFLLCAVSSITATASDHFVEGSHLIRLKRSGRGQRAKRIDYDNIDESLYGWTPVFEPPGCSSQQYACRDKSYCFPRSSLCDEFVSCDDQSDEINALCGYTTTPTVATSTESGITSLNETQQHREEATSGGLSGTLKIAFITVGVAIVALGLVAAIYCLKQKFNGESRADLNQVTPDQRRHTGEKEVEADA